MRRIDSNGNTESSWNWPVQAGFPLLGENGSVVAHWALETAPDEPLDNPDSDFHTVYFDSSIGFTVGPFTMKVRHGTVLTEEKVHDMFTPMASRAAFLGWDSSSDGGGGEVSFPIQVNDDVHLYAKWDVIPEVDPRMCIFALDVGEPVSLQPQPTYTTSIRYGTVLTEDYVSDIYKANFHLEDYKLEIPEPGWYLSVDGKDKVEFPVVVTNNMTLYKHWQPVECQITYNMNGHGTPKPSYLQSYMSYETDIAENYVPEPPDEVQGWLFLRWEKAVSPMVPGIIFVAQWKEIQSPENTRVVYSEESGLEDVSLDADHLNYGTIPNVESMIELYIGECV